jgi:hypothetical protein
VILLGGLWFVVMAFLAACGDDGNDDTLFTGLSGFFILCIVIWAVWHFFVKNRRGS